MLGVTSAARSNLIFGIANLILSAVTSIAVARILTISAYADYATMMAIVSWFLLITEAGGNVGFSRYLKDAGTHKARYSLYVAFARYRWFLTPLIIALLLLAGPLWAQHADLSWPALVFIVLALIVVSSLQGQLGYYVLISTFHHAKALTIAQTVSILKALILIVAAWILPIPLVLASSVLAVSMVSAWWYHRQARRLLGEERGILPTGIVRSAHRHGLVSVFDKFTTAIGNGPFLLIVLAGLYSRPELAMLAVATEFLQKALSVANIPMANMVMPYLHRWQGTEHFPSIVRRSGTLGLLVLLPFLGATLAFAPQGLPLLFGERYVGGVAIVLWAVLPMFTEAWCRMVAGFSIIANGHYKTISLLNGIQGVLAIIMLMLTYSSGVLAVIIGQGVVQLTMSLAILFMAWRYDLIDGKVMPRGLLPAIMMACAITLLMQELLLQSMGRWAAVLDMGCYGMVLTVGMRYMVRLDEDVWQSMSRLAAGKLHRMFLFIFRKPLQEKTV